MQQQTTQIKGTGYSLNHYYSWRYWTCAAGGLFTVFVSIFIKSVAWSEHMTSHVKTWFHYVWNRCNPLFGLFYQRYSSIIFSVFIIRAWSEGGKKHEKSIRHLVGFHTDDTRESGSAPGACQLVNKKPGSAEHCSLSVTERRLISPGVEETTSLTVSLTHPVTAAF